MSLNRANPKANAVGRAPQPRRGDLLHRQRWKNCVRASRLMQGHYAQIYPGVDWSFTGIRQLEYDFGSRPGAGPRRIACAHRRPRAASTRRQLSSARANGPASFKKPCCTRCMNQKISVEGCVRRGGNQVRFRRAATTIPGR